VMSIVDLVESAGSRTHVGILPTAVDAFSHAHDRHLPSVAERYRARMPVTMPASGQQFAFDVSLDACTGCKACVAACHSLNGLDDGEAWRTVGVIQGIASSGLDIVRPLISTAGAEQRTVTSACHHCADPSCLKGCPANAYEKDPVTGAVVHLDDQCIGCSYCTMTCPYEVPTFNDRLGIVRKCDMCRGRLIEGEAPACVQGCPNGAITIVIVDSDALARERNAFVAKALVPGAAASSLSLPTSLYRSRLGDLNGLDSLDEVVPSTPHTPLAVMLVFTQLAVGASLVATAASISGLRIFPWVSLAITAVTAFGLLASFTHLGRPAVAWRVVLGFRHSWLSREAVMLAAFLGCSALCVVVDSTLPVVASSVVGLLGVLTSVMVYGVTGRAWWSVTRVSARFGATVVAGGFAAAALGVGGTGLQVFGALGAAVVGGGWSTCASGPRRSELAALKRTAQLLRSALAPQVRRQRLAAAGAAASFMVAASLTLAGATVGARVAALVGLAALVTSLIIERSLFFTAVAPDRMPGKT
jgi:formate dehydrogenase iron-sulfur subunit